MITDDAIERAVDWLRDNAEEAAQARADRLGLEEYSKSLKARLMKEFAKEHPSIGAQEREALASETYLTHLEAVRVAVHADEKHRYLRSAAEARIEAWRTMSSNNRAIRV